MKQDKPKYTSLRSSIFIGSVIENKSLFVQIRMKFDSRNDLFIFLNPHHRSPRLQKISRFKF